MAPVPSTAPTRYLPAINSPGEAISPSIGPARSALPEHAPQRSRVEHEAPDRAERDLVATLHFHGFGRRNLAAVHRGSILAARVRHGARPGFRQLKVRMVLRNARVPEHEVGVR